MFSGDVPRVARDILRWRVGRFRGFGGERRDRVVYVSELGWCWLKRWFGSSVPEASVGRVLDGRLLFGDFVHAGVLRVLKEVYGERVVTELDDPRAVSGERHVLVGGERFVVSGRVDAILDRVVGIDVKSHVPCRENNSLPKPWHVTQARLYNWLLGLQKTILMYVSPEGVFEYEVLDVASEDEVRRLIAERKSPYYPWECDSCVYSGFCPVFKSRGDGGVPT